MARLLPPGGGRAGWGRGDEDTERGLGAEVALGTDLADLSEIVSGRAGPELPASDHDSGLHWSCADGSASVPADPPPADALASAGLLHWEFQLPRAARRVWNRGSGRTVRG